MRRFMLINASSVVLAVVAMACTAWSSVADAHRRFPVRWDEPRISATIKPGETQQFDVTLTAAYDLPQMSVFVGPKLRPYVTSTATVGPLKRGQSGVVTLIVKGPIDAAATTESGVVSLALQSPKFPIKVPLPRPLTMSVTVVCPCLPPDPGEAGKMTLEGIDSDHDGVRDDVQRFIATLHPNSARAQSALRQDAVTTQNALLTQTPDQTRALIPEMTRSQECLEYVGVPDTSRKAVTAMLINTAERYRAWAADEGRSSGAGWLVKPMSEWKASCAVDPDAFQN